MTNRPIQAGSAIPVAIVASENSSGTQSSGVSINELQFDPVGSHGDGLTISSAQSLVNPPPVQPSYLFKLWIKTCVSRWTVQLLLLLEDFS